MANITNIKRPNNSILKDKTRRTGQFKEFDLLMRELVLKEGLAGIFVENVFNEFLPDVLLRYGYIQLENREPPCFWWEP
jgi:hypothetical protein